MTTEREMRRVKLILPVPIPLIINREVQIFRPISPENLPTYNVILEGVVVRLKYRWIELSPTNERTVIPVNEEQAAPQRASVSGNQVHDLDHRVLASANVFAIRAPF